MCAYNKQNIRNSGCAHSEHIGNKTNSRCNSAQHSWKTRFFNYRESFFFINKTKKNLKGIANLGYRPTFNQKKILLEVNIFNFKGNLYNKKLTVEFLKFIRGEKKFNGVLDLKKQIKIDCKKAKAILSNE